MSRSSWAWARGCELVDAAVPGVGRLSKLEVRENLESEPPVRTRSSLAVLTWVATAVMLMLALNPAAALGKSTNRSGRAPAGRAERSPSHARVTRTERSSDPPHSSGSGSRSDAAHAQVLALGSGYANAHGAGVVRALQRRLAKLGYSPGPIDGRFGPLTEGAVIRFQAAHGLVADGIAGPRTTAALAEAKLVLRPGDGYVRVGSSLVKALQRHLAAAGFPPGPIDGRYGPMTERAVIRFQTARRLRVDGIAGPETLRRLERSTQRTARPRPRPRTAPRPTNRRPAPPRTPTAPEPRRQAQHSTGTSLVPWLIVLACLLAAMLAGLLWYGRRSRGRVSEPSEVVVADAETAQRDPLPQPLRPPDGASAFKLARLLAEAGNVAAAADAFRRADERGHPAASFELGALLLEAGDLAGAEAAFRRADERGDASAASNLGVLLEQRGDLAGAVLAYQRADERGHGVGAWNLGSLLEQQGDLAGAKAAYERAERRGEPGAALDLGVMLASAGDLAGAEAVFVRADQRGDPDGACNLGLLLEQRGDLAGATLAYERADERGHAVAAWNLGSLLEQHGDRAGAKAAYERADQRGYAAGACNLGRILEQEGDRDGAVRAFERASEAGPPEVAELAYAALRELRPKEPHER